MLHDLTRLADYRDHDFVIDESLSGKSYGTMIDGQRVIKVSPAVFKLLQTDFEKMKDFRVRIFPPSSKAANRKKRAV